MNGQLPLPDMPVENKEHDCNAVVARLMSAVPMGLSNEVLLRALAQMVAGALVLQPEVDEWHEAFNVRVQALLTKHAEWEAEQAVLAEANTGGGQ